MRLRDFLILWLLVAVALVVLIPDSRVVAEFWWDYFFPEYVETENGGTALVGYALTVGPVAYLPYVWLVLGVIGLLLYLVRSRRSS